MAIFFTSDLHLGHGNIIKYCHRPFLADADRRALERDGAWHDGSWKGERASRWRITEEAVQLMDDTLINNINKVVGENDTLWHLGDFAFGDKYSYYRKCEEYRSRIKCQNVYNIWGNHDKFKIRDIFTKCFDMCTTEFNGVRIVMCHYALAVWDGSHRGAWHLYGHSHSQAEPWLEANMPGRRSIDVGVDNAAKLLGEYRPFSADELAKLIGGRPGFSMDHHVPRNSNAPREEELV